ncbi:MAG: hypothetical protein RL398_2931 [Planctomycetota bacterium]
MRIAALVGHRYPVAAHAWAYAELDRWSQELGGEYAVFYGSPEDPSGLPPELRSRLGDGVLVPGMSALHADAAEHFRYSRPRQFADLVETLKAAADMSEAALFARQEVRAALGHARMLQAWSPTLLCSYFAFDQALQGFVASRLLGIPWLAVIEGRAHKPALADLLPTALRAADALVVPDEHVARHVVAMLGEACGERTVRRKAGGGSSAATVLRRLSARPASNEAAALGVRAALTTRRLPTFEPPVGVTPFVIVGAERTGSNLLAGAIGARRDAECAGELFNPRLIDERVVAWPPTGKVEQRELHSLRATGARNLYARLLRDAADRGAKAVGCKVLYYQGLADHRIFDHFAAVPGLRVLHLKRGDRLGRYVSHLQAAATDSWYVGKREQPPAPPPGPLELQPLAVARDFELVRLAEELYSGFFPDASTMEFDYSELADDLPRLAPRIGEFLGVRIEELTPRSRKTGTAKLGDRVVGLAALTRAFAGTRWRSLFPAEEAHA